MMTNEKAPAGSATAGAAGPEQNLHIDHTAARQAAGLESAAPSTIGAARDAVAGAAAAVSENVRRVASQARDTVQDTRESVLGARDAVGDAYGEARDRARGLYDDARRNARGAYEAGTERFTHYRDRGYDTVSSGRDSAERFVVENPLLVGVLGLAAGLLFGSLLPRTRREDLVIGRWADEARDQGLRYARDATQRGRQFFDETVGEMREEVRSTRDELRHGDSRNGPSGRYQNH